MSTDLSPLTPTSLVPVCFEHLPTQIGTDEQFTALAKGRTSSFVDAPSKNEPVEYPEPRPSFDPEQFRTEAAIQTPRTEPTPPRLPA